MKPIEKPWNISHQWSYFLPSSYNLKTIYIGLSTNVNFQWYKIPFSIHSLYMKGNIDIISKNIPINISITLGVIENDFIGLDCSLKKIEIYTTLLKEFSVIFSWSYEEMSGIAPHIFKPKIKTYPNGKPISYKIHVVNLEKTT